MKFRSAILIGVVSSIAVSLVIALIAFSILKEMNTELRQGPLYDEIIDKNHALNILVASFVQGAEQDDVSQVKGILQSLDKRLKEIPSRVPGEEVLVRQLQRNNREVGPMIDQMILSRREVTGDLESERRSILSSQLWMKIRFISDDTDHLRNMNQARMIAAQEKTGSIVIALIVMLALTNGSIYFLSTRSIVRAQKALRESEERIKKSLAEKEVMLKEIHHRVKNNLQIISSLVSMQADNLTDEKTREEFDDVCDRVRSMALIHEKLYQTEDLARLNFADYSTSLLHALWSSHDILADKVRLNLALAPVMLTIETAVPCGLILNELAGNALKHAFPNGRDGEVTVGLEHDAAPNTACLWVRDNGVGLLPGLDWRQSSSLGLRLVQILAGQLHGSVETGTSPGAEFRVTFPLKGLQS